MGKVLDNLRNGARRFSFIIITIVAMGALFAYYLFVVVENNEKLLMDREYRGLYGVANTITNKLDVYKSTNAENYLALAKSIEAPKDSIAIRNQNGNGTVSISKFDSVKISNDILEQGAKVGLLRLNALPSSDSLLRKSGSLSYDQTWKIYFYSSKGAACAEVDQFLKSCLRPDLFDNYLVFNDGKLVYQDLRLNLSDDDMAKLCVASTIETDTIKNLSYIHTNRLIEVEVGGQRYKLFLQPFKDGQQHSWVIGGLMTTSEFDQSKKHISGNYLLALIIGIIIVILCLPFLKVYLMNNNERLNTEDLIFSFILSA